MIFNFVIIKIISFRLLFSESQLISGRLTVGWGLVLRDAPFDIWGRA